MIRVANSLAIFACALGAVAVNGEPSICFVSPVGDPPVTAAAAEFRKVETNYEEIARAVWNVTGLGVFEVSVNGVRVGNDFLKPGFTENGKCRHVYSYDITELLNRGKGATNIFSATVSSGWWCDAMMKPVEKTPWQLGKKIAFRGELRLDYLNGENETRGTDTSWTAAYTGPVVSAGIYEGETYDAGREVTGLAPVEINCEFKGELRPATGKITLRRDLELKPVSMYVTKGARDVGADAFGKAIVLRRYKDGETVMLDRDELLVVDFGQNAAAVPQFFVSGAARTTVCIRHAEMLNEAKGEKSRGNDGPAGTPYLASLRSARAELRYTLSNRAETFMPQHTFFGYRYLAVTSDGPVRLSSFRSIPVSSVTREMERGTITTGNVRVNRLIENIRWGVLSNYLSIPTDCPQRDERMGWTADTQIFMNSAAYLLDTYDFLSKYLQDLRDAQYATGLYPCFAPNVRHVFRPWASAGWTDAGILIPYRLWKWYGRKEIVGTSWESMVRYMDFLETHEEPYQINNGDWLAFEHTYRKPNGKMSEATHPKQIRLLNIAFRVWMARLMTEMAAHIGRDDAAYHYAEEEAKFRKVFFDAYVGTDGCLKEEFRGQCNDLYVLKLGLYGNDEAATFTRRDLINNIRRHGNRLQTGFLGTAIIMPVLTFEAQAPEVAYDLLLQDQFPSWLYSVDQGATTVWERWNGYTQSEGFGPVIMNSFNHYAYGCVMEWLFAAAAGVCPDDKKPGFRHFNLKPYPDRRLGFINAVYNSPAGTIRSHWWYDADGRLHWKFSIPSGTTATVALPGDSSKEYCAGDYVICQ